MNVATAESIPASARQAIERAASATGVDFSLLVETARRESSFNASARAPTSSATGLFQFIDSTWLETVRRYGARHGLGVYASQIGTVDGRPSVADPQTRQQILDLRFDPEISARMGAELARENGAALERRLGRPATAGEVYAAHVMGVAGAARLIAAADANAPSAAALFPREAQANPWLFKTRDGRDRSAQALLARLDMPNAGPAPMTPGTPIAPMLADAIDTPAAAQPVLQAAAQRSAPKAWETVRQPANEPLDRAAALAMAQMLLDATRARALSMLSDDSAADQSYALSMYRRLSA